MLPIPPSISESDLLRLDWGSSVNWEMVLNYSNESSYGLCSRYCGVFSVGFDNQELIEDGLDFVICCIKYISPNDSFSVIRSKSRIIQGYIICNRLDQLEERMALMALEQ